MRTVIITGLFLSLCAFAGPIEDLEPGCWLSVPSSHLRDAEKKPEDWNDWNGSSSASYNSYQNNLGIRSIIGAWSGGTYDTQRERLVIFGGGHNGYGGNEVFVFDMDSLKWIRITDPTPFPNRCTPEAAPGLPISRHSYGGLCYIAHVDRMFALGGSPDCGAGGCGTAYTWTFSFATNTWQRMAVEPTAGGCENNCVYWSEDGKVYFHTSASGRRGWYRFNYDADAWDLSMTYLGYTSGMSLAIDPVRKLVVAVGNNAVKTYDLADGNLTEQTLTTTGETFLVSRNNPGIAYDTALKKIVGWRGTNDLYSLDLSTNAWTKHAPSPSNTVNAPAITASGGVYGRFQYSPKYNVYVMVNSVDENVFIYRLTSGGTGVAAKAPAGPAKLELTVSPNPFKATVNIAVSGERRADSKIRISFYDFTGKLVHKLSATSYPLSAGINWSPTDLPAGIYIARVAVAGKKFEKKLFLLR